MLKFVQEIFDKVIFLICLSWAAKRKKIVNFQDAIKKSKVQAERQVWEKDETLTKRKVSWNWRHFWRAYIVSVCLSSINFDHTHLQRMASVFMLSSLRVCTIDLSKVVTFWSWRLLYLQRDRLVQAAIPRSELRYEERPLYQNQDFYNNFNVPNTYQNATFFQVCHALYIVVRK